MGQGKDRTLVRVSAPPRLRLKEILASFEVASAKDSTTAAFFERHAGVIGKEAELSKASAEGTATWALLADLHQFLNDADAALARVQGVSSASDLVRLYADRALAVEWRHRPSAACR